MINTSLKLRRSFIPMLFDTSEWKISDITIDRHKSSQHEQKAVLISDRAFSHIGVLDFPLEKKTFGWNVTDKVQRDRIFGMVDGIYCYS